MSKKQNNKGYTFPPMNNSPYTGGPMYYAPMEHGGYLPDVGLSPYTGGPMYYAPMQNGGIHIKPENRGKFTEYKKRTGKTTEEALHSSNPHVRQMANFARNSTHWNHEYGGQINPFHPLHKFLEGGGNGFNSNNIDYGDSPDDPNGGVPTTVYAKNADGTDNKNPIGDRLNQIPGGYTSTGLYQDINNAPAHGNTGGEVLGDTPGGEPSAITTTTNRPSRRGQFGQGYNNLLGAGMMANAYVQDKKNQRNMAAYTQQQGISANVFPSFQSPGSMGDYTPNGGYFRPNQNTPTRPTMAHGGYVSGSEHDLDENTIQHLIAQGYKIERL